MSFADINGHRVVDLPRLTDQGQLVHESACLGCGTRFTERLQIEYFACPAIEEPHDHDLVSDPDDGLLYCLRCPLVAYDLDDVGTEPACPMPLDRN
ncbi:hypothetical protein AB0P21_24680 [Kribbella sp. NPDC056861]|uniref:hypothetical protein n=1 Tax=Kribbella sp. NPDC056861 TaxID=3154857 RepID=UPI00343E5D59